MKPPVKKPAPAKNPAAKKPTAKRVGAKKQPPSKAKKPPTPKMTASVRALDTRIDKYLQKAGQIYYPVQVSTAKYSLSTGLLGLDLILCGGYRRGRMYTHLGMPSDGKSTLIQEGVASAQRTRALKIYHFDVEGGSSRKYMSKQGIVPDDTFRLRDGSKGYYYFNPPTGDEVYRMAVNLMDLMPSVPLDEEGNPIDGPPTCVFLIDSYDSMKSEGVTVDSNPMAASARMHAQYQPLLRPALRRVGATWVATNQIRNRIVAFGNPLTDASGLALQFYADAKTRLHRRKEKREGKRYVSEVKIKCTKSKMAEPFHEYSARLIIGRGFDKLHDRLEFLVMCGDAELDRGKYVLEGKKYPYATARKAMATKEWKTRCTKLRKDQKTYDWFFGESDDDDKE